VRQNLPAIFRGKGIRTGGRNVRKGLRPELCPGMQNAWNRLRIQPPISTSYLLRSAKPRHRNSSRSLRAWRTGNRCLVIRSRAKARALFMAGGPGAMQIVLPLTMGAPGASPLGTRDCTISTQLLLKPQILGQSVFHAGEPPLLRANARQREVLVSFIDWWMSNVRR